MRIDCGNSKEAKRRLNNMWHPWFAWFPVRVGPHHCVWLGIIERRYNKWSQQGSYDYRPAQGALNWWRTWA